MSEENTVIKIIGPIADSYMIQRGEKPDVYWLTPERKWTKNIFYSARFELDEKDKAEQWLQREIEDPHDPLCNECERCDTECSDKIVSRYSSNSFFCSVECRDKCDEFNYG